MTDEPLTEQEVQEIVDACERGFVPQLPPDTQLTLARDWLRLQQRLAEAERDRNEAIAMWEAGGAYRANLEAQLALAEVERERDLYREAALGAEEDAVTQCDRGDQLEAQLAKARAVLERIAGAHHILGACPACIALGALAALEKENA